MDINEAIIEIKNKVAECERTGEMFDLPQIPDATIVENEVPNEGADLLHKQYKISFSDGERIHIDYHSKDKCHTFQINPDRSVISVKSSRPELDFGDSWDEKC